MQSVNSTTMAAFQKTDDYRHIRTYLNIHELLAVALKNKVFDEDVCYHFWSDTLVRHCKECEAVLRLVRLLPNGGATYLELRKLNDRWNARIDAWHRANP